MIYVYAPCDTTAGNIRTERTHMVGGHAAKRTHLDRHPPLLIRARPYRGEVALNLDGAGWVNFIPITV